MRKVFYHGNCPDGFGAALSAFIAFRYDATYREINYCNGGYDLGEIDVGDTIYFVDFCPTYKFVCDLAANVSSVIILDHHASAIADFKDKPLPHNVQVVFDTDRSGAAIAWNYFNGPSLPKLIQHIQDRDLWRWELVDSRAVSTALWALDRSFETWHTNLYDVSDLADRGRAMLQYQSALIKQIAEHAILRKVEYAGNTIIVPVVNSTVLFSDVCDYLLGTFPECPAALYYFDRKDGWRQWGSRSRKSFDVSEIAKAFGGGGHPQAAGWQTDINWIPEKA